MKKKYYFIIGTVVVIVALLFYFYSGLKEDICAKLENQMTNEYYKIKFNGCSVDSDCIYSPDFSCGGTCISKSTDIKDYDFVWKEMEISGCFVGIEIHCPMTSSDAIQNQCVCMRGSCGYNSTSTTAAEREEYNNEPLVVNVLGYDYQNESTLVPIEGSSVSIYSKTSENYTLILTNYTNSNGMAEIGVTHIGEGEIEVKKDGYRKSSLFFSSGTPIYITIYLNKRQPLTILAIDDNGTPIMGANASIYNETGEQIYQLVETLSTDSNGLAHFKETDFDMAQVIKEGYITFIFFSGIEPPWNGTAILSRG
jgi:hypothetical protein